MADVIVIVVDGITTFEWADVFILPNTANGTATYVTADMFVCCGRWNGHFCETLKNICKRYGIQIHFKSGKAIKDELVAPKDQDHITKKRGIVHRYKYDRLECDEEYIGETARRFGERFKEHLKAPSPIFDHSNITGHSTTLNNFSIVGREEQNLSRLIKESMFIRVNNPSLNRNIGKYHLPHIWDEVLVNNTELKLK